MRLPRASYANVAASLALFLALTGSAVAGAKLLITGADVKNHSLTGADIKNGSLGLKSLGPGALASIKTTPGQPGSTGPQGQKGDQGPTGAQGQTGSQGSTGPQGTPGVGITTATAIGSDVTNYPDLTPLASHPLTATGDYVIFTTLTVHNTGTNNEYLNCGYKFGGTINGAAGVDTTAGGTTTGTSAGVINVDTPGTLDFLCTGNGATTYDISNIKMRVHYLG
jgi:hypothetical protein